MCLEIEEQLTGHQCALRIGEPLCNGGLSEGTGPREARALVIELHADRLLLSFLLLLKADSKGAADGMAQTLSLW